MAWASSGSTNAMLVQNLRDNGVIDSDKVFDAMMRVDRGDFVPRHGRKYEDAPQGIGYGATISAPHMHGYCLEVIKDFVRPGARCLDIGSGTGILTVYMAHMAGDQGRIIGIEHIPELVDISIKNVGKNHQELLDKGVVKLLTYDGRKGYPEEAPYDCIHVGAAVDSKDLDTILQQLKVGGRLVAPVGTYSQELMAIDRVSEHKFEKKSMMGVRYVPLTERSEQLRHG